MSEVEPDPPSGFFDVLNRSRLAVSKKAAGAGVVGLVGFFLILAISSVFFVTENFFIALFGASLAPYVAMNLAQHYGLQYVGYYLAGSALVSLVGLWATGETKDAVL